MIYVKLRVHFSLHDLIKVNYEKDQNRVKKLTETTQIGF